MKPMRILNILALLVIVGLIGAVAKIVLKLSYVVMSLLVAVGGVSWMIGLGMGGLVRQELDRVVAEPQILEGK